jgi:hypothetical protein
LLADDTTANHQATALPTPAPPKRPAHHLAETTVEPALKKQRLVTPADTRDPLWLPGGGDPLSKDEFHTGAFNGAPHGDGIPFIAIDLAADDDDITFVPVDDEFVIGKTSTALVDLGERGHTP